MQGSPAPFRLPPKRYPPLNRCAYCDATEDLSEEHIIPFGLGGNLILPEASCEAHRRATSKVEDFVLRKYLCPLRSYLSLPSRRPRSRPDGYPLTLMNGTRRWRQKVKLRDHPGHVRFMIFDPPGRVAGRPRLQATYSVRFIDANIHPDINERLARLGATAFKDTVTVNAMALARMVAKIAHGFAIAEKGFDLFEELYAVHLVGADAEDWNHWVGGYDHGGDVTGAELHQLAFRQRDRDLSVIVHLFVPYCPRYAYEVVVGRLRS